MPNNFLSATKIGSFVQILAICDTINNPVSTSQLLSSCILKAVTRARALLHDSKLLVRLELNCIDG